MSLLFYLVAGHALADFALQSDAMAHGKNRHRFDPSTVPPGQKSQVVWPYWMASHSLIHGLVVAVITGVWWLGLAEAVVHFGIDVAKCENLTGVHTDQALHAACKVAWWLFV